MQNLNIDAQELCNDLKNTSAVTNGYAPEEKIPAIKKLQTDSRKVEKGDWFICLRGENFDAHEFVEQVLQKQPAGIIFQNDYPFASQTKSKLYGIAVHDTFDFFNQMAGWWRDKINPFVVALTGSNGKTSAKEILFHLLRSWQNIEHANQQNENNTVQCTLGNLNNHFGVPITLLSISEQTKFLVVEIGTNHVGEIAPLSRLVKPDMVTIVSIAEGHIGNFADIQEIALEKLSICEGLSPNGFLLVHKDIRQKEILQSYCKQHAVPLRYADEKVLALNSLQENGSWFMYNEQKFFFPYVGKHQFNNLRLMFALFQEILFQYFGQYFGKNFHNENYRSAEEKDFSKNIFRISTQTLESLPTLNAVNGRLHPLVYKNITIWDDAYNANVASFAAAITFLAQLAKNKNHKQIRLRAAVGQMGELGELSLESHRQLGKLFVQHNFERLAFFSNQEECINAFAEGYLGLDFANMKKTSSEFITLKNQEQSSLRLFHLTQQDRRQAVEFLLQDFLAGTSGKEEYLYILIKGSNATGMKHVVSFLQEHLQEVYI